ncbi:MAG: CotH kinase family protein, partial [Planctomycetota bacterium]
MAGSAIRGNSSYTNRWTLVQITGVESFTPAHSAGTGVVTDGLPANQAAFWFGNNAAGDQGYVAQWHDIDPGADGEFKLISTQYTGVVPTSIHSSGTADGTKGYGVAGIRLIENVPSGPPAIVNAPATNVLAFEAEVGGEITGTGGEVPGVTLYYGTSDGGTSSAAWDSSIDLGGQTSDFTTILAGLDQNTTYYFRTFAENSVGTAWADSTESFTTLTASPPIIANVPATSIGSFAASLGGVVVDTGNDPPVVTVYYGDNDGGANAATWDHSVDLGVQTTLYAAPVGGLEPLTTYYFRAFAENSIGSSWASPSLSFTTPETPPLQITEFMADNATTLFTRTRDAVGEPFVGDTDSPDWIEIHNPTGIEADLGGFHLTDNLNDTTKWQIPSGTTVPAGGYLLVMASGDDITNPALDQNGYLHTNFRLSDDGEDLALSDADGVPIFAYDGYPIQSEDISYGIDASAVERTFPLPTPGTDNANDTPRAPVFSLDSTTFTDSVTLELEKGFISDTIHYTLDESVPNASSPIYTGPLTIADTAMVRAISVGANGKSSTVNSETYIELAANMASRTSNLPIVIVESFGDGVGSGFRDMFIGIIEPGEDNRTRLDSPYSLQTRGGMRIRGSSSAGFAKKQYRVEFWDERNEDRKLDTLGLSAEADWIFYGPSQYDRVLISNPLMFDLSRQIGRYATRTRWVEMYLDLNGGQLTQSDYVGVYAITEVIERGVDRVDVESLSTGAGGLPVEGGFVWKNDRGSAYVDPENPTSSQRSHIDGVINSLRSSAASPNFTDPNVGYAAHADVDSFIDHNILNLLSMNVDALRLSSFYHKTADGKLEAGPIWDFDRSLDSTDGRDNNPRRWFGSGDSTRYFNDSDRVMGWWPDM